MMASVFKDIDDTNKKLMEALLLQNIDKASSKLHS